MPPTLSFLLFLNAPYIKKLFSNAPYIKSCHVMTTLGMGVWKGAWVVFNVGGIKKPDLNVGGIENKFLL